VKALHTTLHHQRHNGSTPLTRSKLKSKGFLKIGYGYFLATRKALKNQVILHNVALGMVGKFGVIEARTRYPQV
jgi:hypothetical protein